MEWPAFYSAPTPTVWRLNLAARDFTDAEAFIAAAREHDLTTLEHEALLEIAIIRYARPFSGNERAENPVADTRLTSDVVDPAAVLSAEDLVLHHKVVRLRNTVVAHSEAAHNPVALTEPMAGHPGQSSAGLVSRRWHVVNECIDLTAFSRIAHAMRWKCLNRLFDLTREARAAPPADSTPNEGGDQVAM